MVRRIESQREQWPHRVTALHRQADEAQSGGPSSAVFTDSTGGAQAGLAAGTGLGVGFGANDTATNLVQNAAGNPYEFGASGPGSTNVDKHTLGTSWDCSGITGDAYSAFTGKDTGADYTRDATGERFNTTSDFGAMGFKPGYQPGAYNIGVNPQPGAGGHMAGELPNGQGFESSGSEGVEYGPGAKDVNSFPQQWYLPGTGTYNNSAANAAADAMKTSAIYRQAVPEHPDRRYLDKLMQHIEDNGWGGMTVRHTPGDAPDSGYMVSLKGTEHKIPLDELSGKSLMEFMNKWHDIINANPEHYMGGWKHGQDWYNDVSRRHDQNRGLVPAARDAFQNDQIALYDLGNDREINTEEAGWTTGSPWKVGHHYD